MHFRSMALAELDRLIEQAREHGQGFLSPNVHWVMCGHIARQVRSRTQRDGPIAAVNFAAERLERHMRTSRLRTAAYGLVTGEAAAEIAEHLEGRLANEGGSAMIAALYTLACHQAARSPNLNLVSALNWCAALQRLFDDMPVDRLETLIKPACAKFPDMGFLKELQEITDLTPRVPSPFADTMEASVQLVPAADQSSKRLVVAMSGGEGRLGLPHTILHQWFAAEPAHMLYLRDLTGRFYHHGIEVFGADWPTMIESVRTIAAKMGCQEIVVFCNSAAGVPGMRAGMQLGAKRIVAFSPRPHGAGEPAGPQGGMEERRSALDRDLPNLTNDWAASSQPEILIVHGDTNKQDKLFASIMADALPSQRWALPKRNRHNTVLEAMRERVLADIISWLCGTKSTLPITTA
jgi:hypothetical protein